MSPGQFLELGGPENFGLMQPVNLIVFPCLGPVGLTLIFCSRSAGTFEQQAEDLVVRGSELSSCLHWSAKAGPVGKCQGLGDKNLGS